MISLPELRRRLGEDLRTFLRTVEELDLYRRQLRASLYRHRIHCGRSNCRCATGPGHLRWCLSYASPRGRHTRTLSPRELQTWTPAACAYREYRSIRARAARQAQGVFRRIDQIQRRLQVPLPPPPRPTRGQRGRGRRKGGRHAGLGRV